MARSPQEFLTSDPETWLAEVSNQLDSYLASRHSSRVMKVENHPEQPRIVSNIPPPIETRGGTRKFDHFYPFEDMKPGDSFWTHTSDSACTRGAVTKFAKRTGWRFITRMQQENGKPNNSKGARSPKNGIRVWRLS